MSVIKVCSECGGAIEIVTRRGDTKSFERCTRCGNDGVRAFISPIPVSTRCPVEDCPGTLDASGSCPCCVKRAAYADECAPKRVCEICGGKFKARGRQKLCKACAKVKAAAQTNAHHAAARARGER